MAMVSLVNDSVYLNDKPIKDSDKETRTCKNHGDCDHLVTKSLYAESKLCVKCTKEILSNLSGYVEMFEGCTIKNGRLQKRI